MIYFQTHPSKPNYLFAVGDSTKWPMAATGPNVIAFDKCYWQLLKIDPIISIDGILYITSSHSRSNSLVGNPCAFLTPV